MKNKTELTNKILFEIHNLKTIDDNIESYKKEIDNIIEESEKIEYDDIFNDWFLKIVILAISGVLEYGTVIFFIINVKTWQL